MIPKTFSASAAQAFAMCPARYKAEYIDKVPRMGGSAGLLGTACHAALEIWVATEQHKQPWPTIMAREKAMQVIWASVYYDYFSDKSRYAEGWNMLAKWVQRTTWDGKEVLSTELKETFDLPTSVGKIPMTYIFDRCDHIVNSNEVEIVDYKTVALPVQPEELKHRIQPRFYAVAAMIKYPWASAIWLTYDLLRWEPVSVRFSREDNVETWTYMRTMAEKIIASDGSQETLNPECRFCVRKQECLTLTQHSTGSGVLGITDMNEAADRRAKLEMARGGLQAAIGELDELIMNFCEREEILEYDTDEIEVKIKAKGMRHTDSERVAKIIGPDLMQKYGSIGVTQVDAILKDEELTDGQRSMLKQTFRKQFGKPRVETKLKSPFTEEP